MSDDWKSTATAPKGQLVMTKIYDEKGARNEAALTRSGNLWFVPDGSMYVYYTPTHWRPLTREEAGAELKKAADRYQAAGRNLERETAAIKWGET